MSPASAAPAIVPGTHKCVGSDSSFNGYRGVVCVDIAVDPISGRVQGRAQAMCQSLSSLEIVQCAGIMVRMWVHNYTNNSDTADEFRVCGRETIPWHDPPCPTGRLQYLHSGAAAHCGHIYDVTVYSYFHVPTVPVGASPIAVAVVSNNYVYNPRGCT